MGSSGFSKNSVVKFSASRKIVVEVKRIELIQRVSVKRRFKGL